ncbi:hypothetical protein N0V88_001371 [Collariella sp. IMI 366227]|nr:hypothetical protein N0V88_001371 [Collariella sp. IMI 366227]
MSTNPDPYAAQRRLAAARAARERATPDEIEARGIRPDLRQIISHMNRTPSHSFKRSKLNDSGVSKVYDEEDDHYDHDKHDDEEREEDEFEEQWQGILAEEGLQDANMFVLAEFRQIARQRIRMIKKATAKWQALTHPPKQDRFKLLASLCTCTELIVEVCKHLRPIDIVTLYSVSKDFHSTINQNMRSSIFAWANHMAPSATRIYSSPVYCRWFVPDPAGRLVTAADTELSQTLPDSGGRLVTAADTELNQTLPGQTHVLGQHPLNSIEGHVRLIPGLLWLQIVVNREIRIRDIIATLARHGHRLPPGAHLTLKKIWLVMDAATTQARMMLLNNPDFFSNEDMYVAQVFMVKLVLLFNDPVYGPGSSMLMRLMLGQRGLAPLWALLRGKKYRSFEEVRRLKLRYDVGPDQVAVRTGMALYGVEIDELGVLHYEGWGTGRDHLKRIDELIPLEAARRQLNLDKCLHEMMIFGHVDLATGNSLVPSLDEMYMSDEEVGPAFKEWKPLRHELIHGGCGNVPFERSMWQPKHARKARWKMLTKEEKDMILEAEAEEIEEVKELQGADVRFEVAWAQLHEVVYNFNCSSKRTGVFRLLQPTVADMQDQLHEFDRPRKLRFASASSRFESDRMQIDSDTDSPPPTAVPSTLPIRPAPQQPLNPDDLSTIPDDDLDLDPIPPNELNRIFHSFRPSHGPHSESDTEYVEEEDDEEEGYNRIYTYNYNDQPPPTTCNQPQPTQTFPAHLQAYLQQNQQQQQQQQPQQYQQPYHPANPNTNPNTTSHSTEEYYKQEDDDETESDTSSSTSTLHSLPSRPSCSRGRPHSRTHPATAMSENTDDTCLRSLIWNILRMRYGGDDGDGDEDQDEGGRVSVRRGGQDNAAIAGVGSGFGAGWMDWDLFLRNPAAYAVEQGGDEGEQGHEGWMRQNENDQDGDDEDDGDEEEQDDQYDGMDELPLGFLEILQQAGDDDETDLDEEMEEGDEEEEEIDINALMEQLQVGGPNDQGNGGGAHQLQQGGQQQEGDEDRDFDIDLYIADEDIGEDERTRKLRDWFRPW